ncbi:DNA replication ATP-dependent helicase/nuclease DNA2 isoform X1 [Histomonas meleagridis]|uniref:DNA replication ATP-dependent helicase/nuclease DNA2 isoform X1 n=1 Tax=Histomonas meleagridis TaxID=135588 RepID=UPI00355941F5|nr:DNA replication ATP-dependent helicase/nuclease DNA2 isoform X1 [Histomonas meleagridis]KAH0797677.1 DNA replication ATP-dependent helicase/nuclease DNA2 isoform X1 [Histomonas meleagridis]
MDFLSDSDDSMTEMSPLFTEVSNQLMELPFSSDLPPSSGSCQEAGEISTTQPLFIVIDTFEQSIDDQIYESELIVRLWPGIGQEERFVHLRGFWCSSKITMGDTAFVIGNWVKKDETYGLYNNKYSMVIDNEQGYFILLPQILIQGTKLAASQICDRKAYLMDISPSGCTNFFMLKGTIIHELIQIILIEGSIDSFEARIDNLLETEKLSLYFIGQDKATFIREISNSLSVIRKISDNIKLNFQSSEKYNFNQPTHVFENIQFLPPYGCSIVNEEESIWSFQWGLKGKIDVTLQDDEHIFPLEIKSGKSMGAIPRSEHILQLAAYIFMMKEKYPEKSGNSGALFYSGDSVSFNIAPTHNELLHIIMKRNKLAHAIAHGTVPSTVGTEKFCNNCSGITACAFLETGETIKSPIAKFLRSNLPYYPNEHHISFYRNFERNLLEEMQVVYNAQTMIWMTPLNIRIRNGRAISDLKVAEGINTEMNFIAKEGTIERSTITKGSFVMFTRNGVPPIVGRGRVTTINLEENVICVEVIESVLVPDEEGICLDIWESITGVDICRTNLLSLFASDNIISGIRLRELVVDLQPPIFDPLPDIDSIDYGLNEDQRRAIQTAIASKDYMLLLGMPGTGKTTTVASLIGTLAKRNERILIASFTHTAVDNLCIKLAEQHINFIRIGQTTSIHDDILRYSLDKIIEETDSVDSLKNVLDNCKIFASTCLGFNHPLISSRLFDVCVVDEASQIDVPTVLGPLSRCKRFILVGDHYQLSPIRRYGSEMNEKPPSLFRILCEAHPHAVVTLRTQYRMNDDILKLCNTLIYNQRMRTGLSGWLKPTIEGTPSILMYDTDQVEMLEMKGHGSKMNRGEAAIISAAAVTLVLCGISPTQIGIISPYRAQVHFIKEALEFQLRSAQLYFPTLINDIEVIKKQLECHTVDKFQGRDKEVVMFSAVKSNRKSSPGVHITDWQRLNVSITRAKTKFILVGSRKTLENSPIFSKMFEILGEKCFYTLPSDVDQANAKPFTNFTKIIPLDEI